MTRAFPFAAGVLLASLSVFAPRLRAATEDFQSFNTGTFTTLNTVTGTLVVDSGTAGVSASGVAVLSTRKLQLTGGASPGTVVRLVPAGAYAATQSVTFNAERWTSASPFTFRAEALGASGGATTVYTGDSAVKVGQNTAVSFTVPAGTTAIRFSCVSPANTGVLIDNLAVAPAQPYSLAGSETYQPVCPVLVRKTRNPVVAMNLRVNAPLGDAPPVTSVSVNLSGTTDLADLSRIRLVYTGSTKDMVENASTNVDFGAALTPSGVLTFTGSQALANGDNWFWVTAEPAASADIDHRVDAGFDSVLLGDGATVTPSVPSPEGSQRMGIALRNQGDDGSAAYRIPGLCTTPAGTLIAAYDIRYSGGADVPANIDIGMSRSTDGGRTWAPMKVIMDMGAGSSNGVSDPCVFADAITGRVWCAALWASNGKGYNASAPGIDPAVTGQLVLTYSDDDGVTWATPYSITPQVKNPAWRLLFQGPGTAITTSDGKLVMPVQYRLNDSGGTAYSSILYSLNHGITWTMANGAMPNTNESQVVEGTDGSLILNCRDVNGAGLRRVASTKNLGATWTVTVPRPGATAATDTSLLVEPTCQASLFRFDHARYGTAFYFSNPDSRSSRSAMTVKVSTNNGRTWPANLRTLYDYRAVSGYSCLSEADGEHLGILYEGATEIRYMRIPFAELLRK